MPILMLILTSYIVETVSSIGSMIEKREDGLLKLTIGPEPNGENGWFIDDEGRVVRAEFCEDWYMSVYDSAVSVLDDNGISFDEVEYATLRYESETYSPEQFRRFSNT